MSSPAFPALPPGFRLGAGHALGVDSRRRYPDLITALRAPTKDAR
ncbi:hypothetical protein [Streptomyces sp. NBC_00280]